MRGAIAGLFGPGANPTGDLTVSDGAGGTANVHLNGLQNFTVQANQLRIAGQTLQGQLSASNGLLSGTLTAGPLNITARNGAFTALGSLAGNSITATGRLALPTTLSNLNLKVDGPYLTARATGSGSDLRGSVLIKAQQYNLQGKAVAQLPAQILPLRGSVIPPVVDLGGLRYSGGWNGRTTLGYQLGGSAGQVRILGNGQTLSAIPTGPVTGTVQLLPSIKGDVSASLAVVRPYLPAQLQSQLSLGRLQAHILPASADLKLTDTRYVKQPLDLNARVLWGKGVTVSAP